MTHTLSNPHAMTLTSGQLGAYLARIGVHGPVSLDFDGLKRMHRAHLLAFTWETLDAFMGWPSSVAPQAAFAKMVEGRRGGWCYEMNGLFGAALSALGFSVTRLCGGVDREKLGDLAVGNHLTLRVDLDRPYLAEVGVADAIFEPVPMMPGTFSQRGFDFSIVRADGDWLRFNNHARGIARSFDFQPGHSDEAALAAMQDWLMQDAGSPFTNALAILRHTEDGYFALQNDILRRVTARGISEQRIGSADQFAETLARVFRLDIGAAGPVWSRIEALRQDEAA